jgi:Flp pilus assembly protein TadD
MKRFLLTAGLFAALALAGSPAAAQTGTARGKVVDDKGQPVADAKVVMEYMGGVTRKLETKTSKKGEFTQVGMQPGPYRFTVSKDGYQGVYIDARVSLGDPTYLPEFKLVPVAAATGGAGGGLAELKGAFARAVELYQAGKLDEAAAAYVEILAKQPSVPEAHYNLGVIYSQKKDAASAEASYLKAIELKPDYAEALVGLANLYQAGGQVAKAEALLGKAAADYPADGKIQFALAVAYFNTGKSAEAEGAFKKAKDLDPDNAEVYYFLGTIAVGQNNVPEAVANLEKYLSMSPTNQQNVATAQSLLGYLKPKK